MQDIDFIKWLTIEGATELKAKSIIEASNKFRVDGFVTTTKQKANRARKIFKELHK
jgi:hypothetical protein